MHNSFLAFLCLCFCTVLKGQALYGTSGLLHMPTADMQKDKTVMLGGNVLDKHPLSTYWNNPNVPTIATKLKTFPVSSMTATTPTNIIGIQQKMMMGLR